jgi:hypothetical protein
MVWGGISMKAATLKKGDFITVVSSNMLSKDRAKEDEDGYVLEMTVDAAEVLSMDAKRMSYQILTGERKGKKFSSMYDPEQKVVVFESARAVIAHADKLNRESSVKRPSQNKRGKNSHDKTA